jgi:catechol 2,3-dioxygenase-like lactoylglutathione lyase family enzyme
MTEPPRVLRVFPRFLVPDVAESLAYYRDVLGFRVSNRSGEPPIFGIVERDGCGLHLKRGEPQTRNRTTDAWDAYFETVGLLALLEECRARGARITRGPEVMPYGYMEIDIVDRDGYVLCFGEECEARPGASERSRAE